MQYSLTIILLSGPIGAGKTALSESLSQRYDAERISTSALISARTARPMSRRDLQQAGSSALFQGGSWIIDALAKVAGAASGEKVVGIDSVRTLQQINDLRAAAAGRWRVIHVHLVASEHRLAARYRLRAREEDARVSWQQAARAPGEAAVDALAAKADLVIDTTRITPADVAVRVGARLRRPRSLRYPSVDILVGGQWGSEGKGNLAFAIAPEYSLLVRAGAPNAGHKVRCHDGAVYTHRQLPSGTRATDAPMLLGAGAVLDLDILRREIADCGVASERLTIDPHALIIESDDIANEAALKGAIGSTGTGSGAAAARRIMKRGELGAVRTACDVPELSPYVRDSAELIERARAHGPILIEGTQGTGLSVLHGSFPHVTSRDTTAGTLLAEVGISAPYLRHVVVAFRAYPIRVGGPSGPMGREISWEAVAERAGLAAPEVKLAERGSVSGSQRRVAEFSWVQLAESVRLNGATDIALTFADYLDVRNREARRLEQLSEETVQLITEIETVTGVPVSLVSASFDGRGPIDLRRW